MVNMRDKIKETKELLKNRFSHYFIFFNDNKLEEELDKRIESFNEKIGKHIEQSSPFDNDYRLYRKSYSDFKYNDTTEKSVKDDINHYKNFDENANIEFFNEKLKRFSEKYNILERYKQKNNKIFNKKSEEKIKKLNESFELKKETDIKSIRKNILDNWKQSLDKKYIEWVLKEIDRFRADFFKEIEEFLENLKKIKELQEVFGYDTGLLFNLSLSNILKRDLEYIKILANFIRDTKSIKELCDMLGRFVKSEESYKIEKIFRKETFHTKVIDVNSKEEIVGRIMLYRIMGKSSFLTVKDSTGNIQAYIQRDKVGDDFYNNVFKKLIDIGDIVGIKGTIFKTKTGEITIYANEIKLLTKSINPLPEKFHGLTDMELRYRQRYVDLIMNDEVKEVFIKRSKMISAIREIMIEHNFLEVETPMMHPLIGGAKAKPFITHHNTLDMTLYLRIAPELYLKRLIVGGFDRVFELNRNFRNEGISTRHNPEFTMMEAYMSFADFNKVMELVEDIFSKVCFKLNGNYTSKYKDYEINFKPPFERIPMIELVKKYAGLVFEASSVEDLMAQLKK